MLLYQKTTIHVYVEKFSLTFKVKLSENFLHFHINFFIKIPLLVEVLQYYMI